MFSPFPMTQKFDPNTIEVERRNWNIHLIREIKDSRTVLCNHLPRNVKVNDIKLFFAKAGNVREVRLVNCRRKAKFNGTAYVEFSTLEEAMSATKLTGHKILDNEIVVQPSHAEKNRNFTQADYQFTTGPFSLYVGSLCHKVTEQHLRNAFGVFGRLTKVRVVKKSYNEKDEFYAFVTVSLNVVLIISQKCL